MATVTWASGVSGDWNNNPSDWSTGAPPNPGDNVVIDAGGSFAVSITDQIAPINSLTIGATGAILGLHAPNIVESIRGNLSNSATVEVDISGGLGWGGSTLSIGGALINSGALYIGNGNLGQPTNVTVNGTLANAGLIALMGNNSAATGNQATLAIGGAAPVSMASAISITGDADLIFGGGGIATVASTGVIELVGQYARISRGADTTNSALSGLTNNAGKLLFEGGRAAGSGGVTLTTTTRLSNSGTIAIDTSGGLGEGGSALTIGGALINSGALYIGNGNLGQPTNVTVTGNLTDTGVITLFGNNAAATGNQATLTIDGAAPATVATAIVVGGDADFVLANGITAIGTSGVVDLQGQYARISLGADTTSTALLGLANNAGRLDLDGNLVANTGGPTVSTAVDLNNSGTILVDSSAGVGEGGSRLTIGGTLINSGQMVIGNANLSLAAEVSAAGIVNNSTIDIAGGGTAGATLTVNGNGQSAVFGNYGTITASGSYQAAVDFNYSNSTLINAGTITANSGVAVALNAGGEVVVVQPGAYFGGAIAGFAPGDTIDLAQVNANGAVLYGGVVTATYNGTVVAELAVYGANQTLYVTSDGNGGTDLSSRYITGTVTTTVVLAAKQPTTVEATGLVSVAQGDAVSNVSGSAATLANLGTIQAYAAIGVNLNAGGTITNGASGYYGLIQGYSAGVAIGGGKGTVVNSGTIAGTGAAGVGVLLGTAGVAGSLGAAAAGGYVVTLANYATISGYTGVMAVAGRDTVTNAGVILGYGVYAVLLAGSGDRLVVDESGVFQGIADGGGGNSVLELAGPAGGSGNVGAQYIGTLAGIGSSFVNFGTLSVDAGSYWEVSGYASQYQFLNDGTIIISNGIVSTGETLVFGSLSESKGDTGAIDLGQGGVAQFTGAVSKGQSLVFTDAYGILQLADPKAFAARISGFEAGDVIDLVGIAADKDTYAKGKLTLSEGGTRVAVLAFAGTYSKGDFQLTPDASGGTYVMLSGGGQGPPPFWVASG